MRHINFDKLDSLPSFEPIHARRMQDAPRKLDRAKPRSKNIWRRVRRLLQVEE